MGISRFRIKHPKFRIFLLGAQEAVLSRRAVGNQQHFFVFPHPFRCTYDFILLELGEANSPFGTRIYCGPGFFPALWLKNTLGILHGTGAVDAPSPENLLRAPPFVNDMVGGGQRRVGSKPVDVPKKCDGILMQDNIIADLFEAAMDEKVGNRSRAMGRKPGRRQGLRIQLIRFCSAIPTFTKRFVELLFDLFNEIDPHVSYEEENALVHFHLVINRINDLFSHLKLILSLNLNGFVKIRGCTVMRELNNEYSVQSGHCLVIKLFIQNPIMPDRLPIPQKALLFPLIVLHITTVGLRLVVLGARQSRIASTSCPSTSKVFSPKASESCLSGRRSMTSPLFV